jgi:hypothetical protein
MATFLEDYEVKRGDTLWDLSAAYGYKGQDWKKVWNDPSNAALAGRRGAPERIQPGDKLSIPIPWTVITWTLTAETDGGSMIAERDGELGKQLSWVQTVYQHNQPVPHTTPFCVDGCPADDDLPFYWTNDEIKADPTLRKRFSDHSARGAPTAAQGTTRWRAVLSLAVVTKLRVTIWNSLVWGWDMTPANDVSIVGPRNATAVEVTGHLNLLRRGVGTGPLTFGKQGWTFRTAP